MLQKIIFGKQEDTFGVSKIVNRYDTDSFGEREKKYNEAYKTLSKWKK